MAIEKKMYVCTDAQNNNNKYWTYEYDTDTQMCTVKYGRVGKTPQVESRRMSRRELDNRIKAKVNGRPGKPPYREVEIVTEAPGRSAASSNINLNKAVVKEAATKQLIKENPELSKLIEVLVQSNKHELFQASGGKLNVDVQTGIVSTPVGVITVKAIQEARAVLDELNIHVERRDIDSEEFIRKLNNYLMLVPQEVGRTRGWHRYFFTHYNNPTRQSSLLDQLEASAELAAARLKAAEESTAQTSLADTPNLFNAELNILTDDQMISKIERMFYETVSDKHSSRRLKPAKFYEVTLHDMQTGFEKDGAKLPDIRLLWHGTRKFNVLSILKSGFLLSRTLSTMQIVGAMFGNGIYFSDQSTKALNYSYGGIWDRGTRDTTCYMFLADVAMGRHYVPSGGDYNLPKPGYDSTWAIAGKSGVYNNEMIVYRTTQTNIRYLIEFEEK
jgi:poly [ADP-ribose] polymerase